MQSDTDKAEEPEVIIKYEGNRTYVFKGGEAELILALIESEKQKTAKAYGACTKCYGKGYATVNDRWIGYDTDTDIGSPGGVVRGGEPIAMKYCDCDRGKQLQGLVKRSKS